MCYDYGHLTVDMVDEMEAEVFRRVFNGDSFTALEISRAVQARGIRERHRDLKVVVHALFENGDMIGYDRTPINLPTGERPYFYHPAQQKQSRFATATNTRMIRTTHAVRLGDSVLRTQNSDRLRLPSSLLRAAGFYPGDTVYVAQESDTLVVYAQPGNAPIVHPRKPYRVGADNSVRVPVEAKPSTCYIITFRTPGVLAVSPQN
jgi:hypothetical protein